MLIEVCARAGERERGGEDNACICVELWNCGYPVLA